MPKYLLLGAGATSLGAAYRLRELNYTDFLVLEAQDFAGGLATSFCDEKGFWWDIGGHVQFSHYPYFDKLMELALGKEGWLHHERESWVWIYDRFVPYPFQNNLHRLPPNIQTQCLSDLQAVQGLSSSQKPAHFLEWLEATFGKQLVQIFMQPYNEKVWAFPLQQLQYQWIAERVALPNIPKILENIQLQRDEVSWGANATFQFPKYGGTGSIWKTIAEHLIGNSHFRYQHKVQSIDFQQKKVWIQGKKEPIAYQYLFSTLPLDILMQLLQNSDTQLTTLAQSLKHSSTNIVGIGLRGQAKERLKTKCWMYFPESNCPFYRVTVFSNYSPHNVPDAQHTYSLMTETSESAHKPVNIKTLVQDTIQGLLNCQLIDSAEDVISVWQYRAEYGYPTPSLERDSILNQVIPYLEKHDIYSRGRFGGWKYEVSNQDHSCMQGVEWADKMLLAKPETTYKLG